MKGAESRSAALTALVDWFSPRLQRHQARLEAGIVAGIALDTGISCGALLSAARHFATWPNHEPRFTAHAVHGDGSEATIIMRNTRPDDLPAVPGPSA
eukprot:2505579-Alexandrium_andersonii.AAC.1